GIMVGLGEERNEVLQLMDDLRAADVDFLTIGQYLQPTRKHHEVVRFVTPDQFKAYETIAYAKGFLMVSASPLTRASHGPDAVRRVLVIGPPGAGKSTLATRLAAKLGLPVHHLDLHHWMPGWQYRT